MVILKQVMDLLDALNHDRLFTIVYVEILFQITRYIDLNHQLGWT